jgi:hypothetical protein
LDKLISLKPTVLYFSHFGKADNAIERLKDYKQQLKLWADIAEEGVRKNLSFQEIRDSILLEDLVMGQVLNFLKAHQIYSKTVLENCVRGFIEYAKQKQSS